MIITIFVEKKKIFLKKNCIVNTLCRDTIKNRSNSTSSQKFTQTISAPKKTIFAPDI